jgi:hypothetical protein
MFYASQRGQNDAAGRHSDERVRSRLESRTRRSLEACGLLDLDLSDHLPLRIASLLEANPRRPPDCRLSRRHHLDLGRLLHT